MYGLTWVKKMLTEGDNQTQCPIRIGAVFTGVMYHAGLFWILLGQKSPMEFAFLGSYIQHMSVLMGVSAVSIGAKSLMHADHGDGFGGGPGSGRWDGRVTGPK